MPYCSKCGAQVDDEALFCKYCGASLKTQSESAANDRNYGQTQTSDQAKRPTYSASRRDLFSFTDMLDEGEVLCRESELNRRSIVPFLIVLAVGVIVLIVWGAAASNSIITIIMFCFLLFTVLLYFPPLGRRLAFTNRRIIGRIGKVFDIPLDEVIDVSVSAHVFGRAFGYGSLKISAGSQLYRFRYVDQPQEFRDDLMRQIELFKKGRR